VKLIRLTIAVAAVTAFVFPASPTAIAASTTHCSGSVSSGFWTKITATNVTCPAAKTLIKKWIKASGFGGQGNPKSPVTVGAYTCKIKFKGEAANLTCTASGSKKVTAHGNP
jgi:hypothetical protein